MKGFMITDADFFVQSEATSFGPRAAQVVVTRGTFVICGIFLVSQSLERRESSQAIYDPTQATVFMLPNDQPSQQG